MSETDFTARERRALAEVERLLDLDEAPRAAALTALDQEDAALAGAVRRLLARNPEAHDWMPTEAAWPWCCAASVATACLIRRWRSS